MKQLIVTSLAVTLFYACPALGQGEHGRRVAAELLIMRGDLRQLTAKPPPMSIHQKGLRDRLQGGLSGLAILLRLADQEAGRAPSAGSDAARELRQFWQSKKLAEMNSDLSRPINNYPLVGSGLFPAVKSRSRLERGRALHDQLCAGCHDDPNREVERPAHNLSWQARSMSAEEFAARLIIGVRGDSVTGISNPFSDEDLAALTAFYSQTTGGN